MSTVMAIVKMMALSQAFRIFTNSTLFYFSFHVGSNCTDASSYVETLEKAKLLFDEALNKGFAFSLLDIGGGFPGSKDCTAFDEVNFFLFFSETFTLVKWRSNFCVNKSFTLFSFQSENINIRGQVNMAGKLLH